MRVTERGQVTIPKEIRDRFGFEPRAEVEFVVHGETHEFAHSPGSWTEAVGELYGRRRFGATADELMKLLRE